MSAGVAEQEGLGLQLGTAFLGGGVVHNRAVGAVTHDGLEARADVAGLLGTEVRQLLRHGDLVHVDLADVGLHPAHEFGHRRAVLDVGNAEVVDFLLVLAGLGQVGGIHLVDDFHAFGHTGLQLAVDHVQVEHHLAARIQAADEVVHVLIGADGHAVVFQVAADFLAQHHGVDEEHRFIRRHSRKAQHHGGAGHVRAAQVHQPAHVHEGGDDHRVRAFLHQGSAQVHQLFRAGLAHHVRRQLEGGLGREGGAIRPDLAHQVILAGDGRAALFRQLAQVLRLTGGHHAAVEGQDLPLLQVLLQIGIQRGDAGLAHLHQVDAGALQLIRRLQEVAAVGPQSGPIRADQQRASAASKAADPLAGLEVAGKVLRAMEVVGGNKAIIHAVLCHRGAQVNKLLTHRVHILSSADFRPVHSAHQYTIIYGNWQGRRTVSLVYSP